MDWSNERYVRLYTRDTPTWQRLRWEGQSLLCLILRKVDRSGVMDGLGEIIDDLSLMTGMPPDITEIGYKNLLKYRVIANDQPGVICLPNFIAAQETPRSDAQRQRDSRERRRGESLAVEAGIIDESCELMPSVAKRDSGITKRDARDTERDKESRRVTPSHAASRGVTPNRSLPVPIPKPSGYAPAGIRKPIQDKEQYEYMGEQKNLTQQVVAVVMKAFGDWPLDQLEQSISKFGVSKAGISLDDWKGIARDAYKALEPGAPVRGYHKALSWQMDFYLRNNKGKAVEAEWDPEIDPLKQGWTHFLPLGMCRPFHGGQAEALEYSKQNDKPEDYARYKKAIEEFNARRAGGAGR